MNDYVQYTFRVRDENECDMLVALLNEQFDGFEQEGTALKAFVRAGQLNEELLAGTLDGLNVEFTRAIIEEQNWNAVWESNFSPVTVDDFVGLRAEFHEPMMGVEHEIIITPKMSFGTGHHATTYLMIQQMRTLDFAGKRVLDFGTGTGVLAILASKLGAKEIVAIDNDNWSIDNAMENIDRNRATGIELNKAETIPDGRFDIILANINKQVIMTSMPRLANALEIGGRLCLSGLLLADESDIVGCADNAGLRPTASIGRDNWLYLSFSY